MDISLKCRCGSMRGVARNIAYEKCIHIVCLCDDCQAFAHYLGQAETVLDKYGGTDIFQLAPCNLHITQGAEHLQCLRLTDKGMYRWYAGCCKTPIANTAPMAKLPFAGMIHAFMDHAGDGQSRDQAVGPIRATLYGKFGIGHIPKGVHQAVPLGLIARILRFLLSGWINNRHTPSPFFDLTTGKPVSAPYVLATFERDGLRKLCGPRP